MRGLAGRDEDTIDIAARKSIAASVRAESLAIQRKEARDKRNEQTRTDAEMRAAENKYTDAQEQIADLKSELAREIRNRELAERDAMNYSGQLKELREENGKLREDLGRIRVEVETANAKLAAAAQAAENEKKALQEAADNDVKVAKSRAAEAELISSLKTFGTVSKNERGIVLTLPETLWAGTRSTTLVPQADGKLTSLGEILSSYPDYRISVEAHTDNTGAPAQIQTVTDKRSYSLAEKFATMGVEEGRIVAKGYGASVPVAPNTTNANKAKNRRIQVILVPYTR